MFGALTYLPLFQQVVRGSSPTVSGLQLLPVMGGAALTSIVSGQIITRTGRYRVFPIAGTAIGVGRPAAAPTLDRRHRATRRRVYMLIFGLGLGMVMQVLVLAVQNAVSYEELGVATSRRRPCSAPSAARSAPRVLGAIFANRLATRWRAAPGGRGPRG